MAKSQADLEHNRLYMRRYSRSPAGKATAARYEGSPRALARRRRWRKRRRQWATHNLPVEVIQPFLARALHERSYLQIAEVTGVHDRNLRRYMRGEVKSVPQAEADKLCTIIDATLDELVLRAREWAELTGSKWPTGYHPRQVVAALTKY
jgi:hypothetical protein